MCRLRSQTINPIIKTVSGISITVIPEILSAANCVSLKGKVINDLALIVIDSGCSRAQAKLFNNISKLFG